MNWAPKEPVSQEKIYIDMSPQKNSPAESNLFARFRTFKSGDGAKSEELKSTVHSSPPPCSIDEVTEYMALPAEPQGTNLLEWWAENSDRFPHLALMARQYLSVPATSASAERLFSLAGANFSDHRKNMTDEHLADLLFAKINVFMNRRFQAKFMNK